MPTPRSLFLLLLPLFVACGPSPGSRPLQPPPDLAPYTAADAALLDDRISPEVFGAVVDASDPVGRRASLADGIVRARMTTVTREAESYVLELQPVLPPLKGPAVTARLTLNIGPQNPSYVFVKSFDSELVGRSVIVIYKRFAEGGQATLRWHIEDDNPRVSSAIDRARLMGELGR